MAANSADLSVGSLSLSGTSIGTEAALSAGEGREVDGAGDEEDANEALRPTVFVPAVDASLPRPGVERLLALLDSTLRVVIADGYVRRARLVHAFV
jgi:hypothetical protein